MGKKKKKQKMKRKLNDCILVGGWTLAILLCLATRGWADEVRLGQLQETVATLKKQMADMQKVISQQNEQIRLLGGKAIEIPSSIQISDEIFEEKFNQQWTKKVGDVDKWLKDLKFKGDFRLRYEAFQQTSGHPAETDDRNRFQFRLRYGFEKKFQPDMKMGFYMASGSTNDPTSTNQSFDGLFTFKSLQIERAWAQYNPSWAQKGPMKELEIAGGKFKNPFERGSSKIIWDRDVRPEGAYEMIELRPLRMGFLETILYGIAGQFILDEDSSGSSGADAELYAYQLGLEHRIQNDMTEKPMKVRNAISFYNYSDYAINNNFGTLARGNPNTVAKPGGTSVLDAGDFDVFEVYNEIGFQFQGLPPLKLFFDWAKNLNNGAPDSSLGEHDTAWAMGIKLGKAKKKGSWEFGYEYRYIDPNAVPGFNDSDFGTTGHSDKRGSVFSAKYQLTDQLQLAGAAFFVNNISADSPLGTRDEEQRRFQLDLVWKF